jgi:hypothetical protein
MAIRAWTTPKPTTTNVRLLLLQVLHSVASAGVVCDCRRVIGSEL